MFTFEQIQADIKNKIFKPIYYLMGEESYFIDEITSLLEKSILPEDEKAFNQTVFYGKDVDMGTLLTTARRFPMMSNYNVVILREAQNLRGIDGLSAKDTDPFLLYAENPPPSTILIVNLKGKILDKRKKIFKTLDKSAVLMESKPLYDNKVGSWISKYIKDEGYSIDLRATELMASSIGNNLSKVVQEIKKLIINIPKGNKITLKDIEDNVGISKDFNVFELQNALGSRDVYKANLIVTHLGKNPKTKSIIPHISMFYLFFTKILMMHSSADQSERGLASVIGVNPYFMRDYTTAARNYPTAKCIHIISFLREYDAKSKGIDSPSVDDLDLMRELVYKILHI